jgi:lipoprotein-releasing system permease protein
VRQPAQPGRYELLIGLRYTRAQPREGVSANRFISFIALISMLGLALGVAALIVVLSVMNGFQKELRERILGVVSHVQVSSQSGELADWSKVVQGAAQHPRVKAAAPYVQAQGMLSFDGQVRGMMVRGILPEAEDKVADFASYMKSGKLDALRPGEFGMVLGSELARALRVVPGDKVTLLAPQGTGDAGGDPAAGQAVPRGRHLRGRHVRIRFRPGADPHGRCAKALPHGRSRLRGAAQGRRPVRRAAIGRELLRFLAHGCLGQRLDPQPRQFLPRREIEKRMMFLILLLIVAVAAFNIVSTLVMAVTDKRADIAILRTLGASPGSIMAIFIVQGVADRRRRAGGRHRRRRGAGAQHRRRGAGAGACWACKFLAKDVYYISDLPSDLHWSDVGTIGVVSFVLTLLATLYPSWRASRTQPAEALAL